MGWRQIFSKSKERDSRSVEKSEEEEDSDVERGNWSSSIEALLSYIGYCVGLGNIWRFPYLCYRNGGGAFLIPYFIMLSLAGLPLYFLELAIGQYASQGATTVWKLSPLFKGIGCTAVMASALCCIYYNHIIAYAIFYLFSSMTSELPWSTCDNEWNTPACRQRGGQSLDPNATLYLMNSTNLTEVYYGVDPTTSALDMFNTTVSAVLKPKSPGEEYFDNFVLHKSAGIEYSGTVEWRLVLCLMAAWTIIFFCLIKGIKSTGKVVYVTATFPYLVLAVLFVRGITLPGAKDGLIFYLVPDFNKLKSPRVWGDAASQIFYSLGPAWGILTTYSSYNHFSHNSHRDAVVSSLICCGTSIFAGAVIFSVIGYIALELQLPISEVMSSGPGLVFVVYPEAVAKMPIAPLWSVIFFAMLVTVAMDSMFATFETVISAIVDEFPNRMRPHRTLFTLIMCIVFFLLGMTQTLQSGIYWLTLMDWYIGTFPPLFVALGEVLVISYVYGFRRFSKDIELMMGFKPNMYWIACWLVLSPLTIMFIVVFNAVNYVPVRYDDYQYPVWAEVLGWLMCAASLIFIPITMVYMILKSIGGIQNLPSALSFPWTGETLSSLMRPASDWLPAHTLAEQQKEEQFGMVSCVDNKLPNCDYRCVPVDREMVPMSGKYPTDKLLEKDQSSMQV